MANASLKNAQKQPERVLGIDVAATHRQLRTQCLDALSKSRPLFCIGIFGLHRIVSLGYEVVDSFCGEVGLLLPFILG